MTFCKVLKRAEAGGITVEAWEEWDKFASAPRYSVTASRDGITIDFCICARTTWRRKYAEVLAAYIPEG